MTREGLLDGYGSDEKYRINRCLNDFWDYAPTAILVGGLAIEYFCPSEASRGKLNDLDFCVGDFSEVHPDIVHDFWIGHVHEGPYLLLVHRKTGIKVDVFANENPHRERNVPVKFGNRTIPVTTAEHQLARALFDLQNPGVDQKQFIGAKALLEIVDLEVAQQVWAAISKTNLPVKGAIEEIRGRIKKQPAQYQTKSVWTKLLQAAFCRECISHPGYPQQRLRAYACAFLK